MIDVTPQPITGPMTAIVEFQVPPEEISMDDWLTLWAPRGADALYGEPETPGYEAAVSLEDPSKVIVYERYSKGDSSLAIHMQRPSHAEIATALKDNNVSMNRTFIAKFVDIPDYGWWSRPEQTQTFADEGAFLVFLGMNFETDAMRKKFIELSSGHADYCLGAEPDTLVYSGGVSVADPAYGIEAEADLLFVMGCKDMAAMQKHSNDPRHLALASSMKNVGCTPEITFMKTYRTTGKGYLWRA